jgi:hypothetical protein
MNTYTLYLNSYDTTKLTHFGGCIKTKILCINMILTYLPSSPTLPPTPLSLKCIDQGDRLHMFGDMGYSFLPPLHPFIFFYSIHR